MSIQSYPKKGKYSLEEELVSESQAQQEQTQLTPSIQALQQDGRKRDKERVQLDFSPDALRRLDALKELLESSTRAEVIRLAIRLLEWLATETHADDTIQVTNDEGQILTKFKVKLLFINRT